MYCKRCSSKEKKVAGEKVSLTGFPTVLCDKCRDEYDLGVSETAEFAEYVDIETQIKAKQLANSTDEKAFYELLKRSHSAVRAMNGLARKFVNG